MITVTLYTRAGCELCKQAEEDLKALQEIIPHQLAVLDIDSDPSLRDTFALEIPVVEAGPFRLKAPFTRQDLKMTLAAAADRRRFAHVEIFRLHTDHCLWRARAGQSHRLHRRIWF